MLPRAASVAAMMCAIAAPARAEGPAITWEAPPGCPSADEVRARVAANLGRRVGKGEVTARLVVSRAGKRWRVVMTVRTADADGERSLEASSCREAAESAALIVAMTIEEAEPEIVIEPPPEPRIAEEELPPLPDLRRVHRDTSVREPSPPLDIDVRVRALVGGDLGTMPLPATLVGAGIEVSFGPWSADLGAQRFGEQRALKPGMPTQGADVDLTTVTARGCYSGGPAAWRAAGCLGADVGRLGATGFGFTDPEPRATTYGGGPQLGVVWAIRVVGPIAARVDVAATWLVVRPLLVDGEGMVVHDPNMLVWRGFVGVEATWE